MPGSVSVVNSSNFRGLCKEQFRTITITSDSSDGSVPDQDIFGLSDSVLKEYAYSPDDTNTPDNTFDLVIVEKANPARIVYESGADGGSGIDATAFKREMAVYTGDFPRVDGPLTIKFVSPANHAADCNIGNSKVAVLVLRFEKK